MIFLGARRPAINYNRKLVQAYTRVGMYQKKYEMSQSASAKMRTSRVSFWDTLSTHTFQDALQCEILDKYSKVDFDVSVSRSSGLYICLTCRISRKIFVTSLELSSLKSSKRNSMYGKVPLNMQMIEEVWLWTTSELQAHFSALR